MKKKYIIIILLVLVVLSLVIFIIYNEKSKEENKKDKEQIYVEDQLVLRSISIDNISNDISNIELKINDRVDIYIVSDVVTGEPLNYPIVSNVRVASMNAGGSTSLDTYDETLKNITISIPKDVSASIHIAPIIPTTAFVIKKSNSNDDKITINYELVEELKKHYEEIKSNE